jgi:hypothetical protein
MKEVSKMTQVYLAYQRLRLHDEECIDDDYDDELIGVFTSEGGAIDVIKRFAMDEYSIPKELVDASLTHEIEIPIDGRIKWTMYESDALWFVSFRCEKVETNRDLLSGKHGEL